MAYSCSKSVSIIIDHWWVYVTVIEVIKFLCSVLILVKFVLPETNEANIILGTIFVIKPFYSTWA